MRELKLKRNSVSLFFVIAYALPVAATIGVVLVAGAPPDLVVREISVPTLVVVMAMVHAPTIAAVIVVMRSQGLAGIRILFGQLGYWKFAPQWYLKAILIFPGTILIVLFVLSFSSPSFLPVLSFSVMAFGALFGSLWEEIGWTGFATPVMLRRFSPLQVGLVLGILHAMWHLAAGLYGAGAFHGQLFLVNFLATSIGIVGLRIVTLWIYAQTSSLVLGWLTHASFTAGQLLFVSLALTSAETVVWNAAFSVSVIGIAALVVLWNKELMRRCPPRSAVAA
jgi:hypothetical protein